MFDSTTLARIESKINTLAALISKGLNTMPTSRVRDMRRRPKTKRRMFVDSADAGRVNVTTWPAQSRERREKNERFTVQTEAR
jgi:hypothetical protein